MRALSANQNKALQTVAKNEPLTEKEALEKIGKGAQVTLKALYTRKLIGRNRRGRGGDFVLTEQGREILAGN